MLHTTNELQKKTLSYIIMYRNDKKKIEIYNKQVSDKL